MPTTLRQFVRNRDGSVDLNTSISQEWFNAVLGVEDPSVFIPPANCKPAPPPHPQQPSPPPALAAAPAANRSLNASSMLRGIDVSHYQGAIDWHKVATVPGMTFACAKVCGNLGILCSVFLLFSGGRLNSLQVSY
jgi:hypothetical protein